MTFEKGNFSYYILFIIVGGILGWALGNLIVQFFPSVQVITKNLTGPIGFNLELIELKVRLNLMAILGIIAGFFICYKI